MEISVVARENKDVKDYSYIGVELEGGANVNLIIGNVHVVLTPQSAKKLHKALGEFINVLPDI